MNPETDMLQPSRHTARQNILFAFIVAILLLLGWFVRGVLIQVYVSALLAVVTMPLVRMVQRVRIRGWSPGRGLSIMAILIAIAALLAVFVLFAVPPMVSDMHNLVVQAPQHATQIAQKLRSLPLLRNNIHNLDVRGRAQQVASTAAGAAFSALPNFARILLSLATSLILIVYFISEGDDSYHWLIRLLPRNQRERLDKTLISAEKRMGKWLLGQGSLMLILGLCSLIVFYVLHLRYYYALAVLMGLFNIIPVIGAVITVFLAMAVAALDSWTKVAGVAIFYAIYAQVEQAFLTPRIMKSSVDLSGSAVIVAFLFGAAFAGVLGALVSVPTAVLIVVLLEEYAMDENASDPEGDSKLLS